MLKPPIALAALAGALIVPHTAWASLGGNVDTITADQSRMMVRYRAMASAGTGALHTLSLANGGEIREYTNASGMVFAVRWTGPGKPDLVSLLGPSFATMQSDNPISARHGLRRAPVVNRTDLKIVTGGRAGAFWGYAWLPQSAPAGFDPASM